MSAEATTRSDPQPQRPILVVFHSTTCGRCRRADGFLAQVLQRRRNHDSFTICRVDGNDRPDLLERFRVSRLPTFAVVESKRIRARLEQPRNCGEIERLLSPWLR